MNRAIAVSCLCLSVVGCGKWGARGAGRALAGLAVAATGLAAAAAAPQGRERQRVARLLSQPRPRTGGGYAPGSCGFALQQARGHIGWQVPIVAHASSTQHISFCLDHCGVHTLTEDANAQATPRPELARYGWYAPAR